MEIRSIKGFAIVTAALWVGLMLAPLVKGFAGNKGKVY